MTNDLLISATKLIEKLTLEGRLELAKAVADITDSLIDLKESAQKLEDKILWEEYGYLTQDYD